MTGFKKQFINVQLLISIFATSLGINDLTYNINIHSHFAFIVNIFIVIIAILIFPIDRGMSKYLCAKVPDVYMLNLVKLFRRVMQHFRHFSPVL